VPTVGGLAVLLSAEDLAAAVPHALLDSTVRAATRAAAGKTTAGLVSATIAKLVHGVLLTMLISRSLKLTISAVLTAALLLTWSGRAPKAGADQPAPPDAAAGPAPAGEKSEPPAPPDDELARQQLKVETDLEILQLNVGIMKEELAKFKFRVFWTGGNRMF
jgi:RNA polymerase sigma-70 factor (ECF subfamily)